MLFPLIARRSSNATRHTRVGVGWRLAPARSFAAGVALTRLRHRAMASMAALMLTLTTKTPPFLIFVASERSQGAASGLLPKRPSGGRVISSGPALRKGEQVGIRLMGELIYLALTIAGHKINRVGRLWLGDDLIETFVGIWPATSCTMIARLVTSHAGELPKLAREDMIGQGIARVSLTLKFNAEKFPPPAEIIKMEKFGAEVRGSPRWPSSLPTMPPGHFGLLPPLVGGAG